MNTLTQRCITLHCLSVDDHGHCSTSVWQDADKRAELSLYLLKEEGLPLKDDELEVNMVFQTADTQASTEPAQSGASTDAGLSVDPATSSDSTASSSSTQASDDESSTSTDPASIVSGQVADTGGVSEAQSGGA